MLTDLTTPIEARAQAFVTARLMGVSLAKYPGLLPVGLSEAYAIQDHAIALWPDAVAGWKVGRIVGPEAEVFNTDRLVGPIFSSGVRVVAHDPVEMKGFADGFIAIEGEYVFVTATDAPRNKTQWSLSEALDMVAEVHIGIEVASSPFGEINDLGPLVTISDFGNNNGLALGAAVPDWRSLNFSNWRVTTSIDGREIGSGVASGIPGGPIESLRACLEICAERGFPLPAGTLVSTGAVSGVHRIEVGQSAKVSFEGLGDIHCRIVPVPRT